MTATQYETDHYGAGDDAVADDELDLDAAIASESAGRDEDLDDSSEDDADDSGDSTGGAKAKAAAKPSRGLFRRVAVKTIEVQDATDTVRALAAAQLGSSEDVVELVASIMAAGRVANSPLADIQAITDGIKDDPWGVAVTATSMGRTRLKALWTLLHTLGVVGTPVPPASDAKAGVAAVKAVHTLTDDHQLDLLASGELLKRS